MRLDFHVLGVAEPYVRVSPGGKRGGVYQDRGYLHWKTQVEDAAREAARAAGWKKTTAAVNCDCTFVLVRRPTKGKAKILPWPSAGRGVGDRDNYDKGVLDALTRAGIWKDDMQVCTGRVVKRWQEPGEGFAGVIVSIWPLEDQP